MISSLMIVTSLAMFAFPKQLRGNRIPAPHQIESIDAHKPVPKTEQSTEDTAPQLKGIHRSSVQFNFIKSCFAHCLTCFQFE